jgi:hypothetical protein
MTLVILGLLLGLVGIVWVIVLDIVRADRQCQRPGLHKSKRPVTGPMHESKAA